MTFVGIVVLAVFHVIVHVRIVHVRIVVVRGRRVIAGSRVVPAYRSVQCLLQFAQSTLQSIELVLKPIEHRLLNVDSAEGVG